MTPLFSGNSKLRAFLPSSTPEPLTGPVLGPLSRSKQACDGATQELLVLRVLLGCACRESHAADMEALCVVAGSLVWAVRLELHVVDHGGYALRPEFQTSMSMEEGPRLVHSLPCLEMECRRRSALTWRQGCCFRGPLKAALCTEVLPLVVSPKPISPCVAVQEPRGCCQPGSISSPDVVPVSRGDGL